MDTDLSVAPWRVLIEHAEWLDLIGLQRLEFLSEEDKS